MPSLVVVGLDLMVSSLMQEFNEFNMVDIFSKTFLLWSAFSLVYSKYAANFQRPYPMILSEFECSRYLASTAGIAALREWLENCLMSGPRCTSSSFRTVSFRLFRVRFFPELKLNTGQSGPLLTDSLFGASSVFTGHTSCPWNPNMST